MLTAIAGINWGDEGKGRMVDMLSDRFDIICRYQGGNNAGHTVINDMGMFKLNLLPSGIFRKDVVNIMGCGMVVDIEHLCGEIEQVRAQGVDITPQNLKLSESAFICMPYHKMHDILEEERLADKKYGSTRRGIAPAYGDKYMKKALRVGELLELIEGNTSEFESKLGYILEWKNLTLKGYPGYNKVELSETLKWLRTYGAVIKPFIANTSKLLQTAVDDKQNILFEAQLGALRDIDYGIYPYTTSSQTLAAYAPIGAGIPGTRLNRVIGVTKAYSSCVGEGPFAAEMFGDEARALRVAGGEFGAATGRPRRVGGFDMVASRYGVSVQGADELALTKLDVISNLDKIPVCVAYNIDGVIRERFPIGGELARATPVIEYMEGWQTDITKCRTPGDLPRAALNYIKFIEKEVKCSIKYVSVGAGRDEYLIMEK
ncbi:MAG: adenylosuccinate synthase [Oscillospiraceae bacterium]|nr:adenylosuccinate synthase [Oscillospiraceae bacterium]